MYRLMFNEYNFNAKFRRAVDDYVSLHNCTLEDALDAPEIKVEFHKVREL